MKSPVYKALFTSSTPAGLAVVQPDEMQPVAVATNQPKFASIAAAVQLPFAFAMQSATFGSGLTP